MFCPIVAHTTVWIPLPSIIQPLCFKPKEHCKYQEQPVIAGDTVNGPHMPVCLAALQQLVVLWMFICNLYFPTVCGCHFVLIPLVFRGTRVFASKFNLDGFQVHVHVWCIMACIEKRDMIDSKSVIYSRPLFQLWMVVQNVLSTEYWRKIKDIDVAVWNSGGFEVLKYWLRNCQDF